MSKTLYVPVNRRTGLTALPHDTMKGANIYCLENGGPALWRVELISVKEEPQQEVTGWRGLTTLKPILTEVRKLSPEITQELSTVRNRIPSLQAHD